MVVVGDYIGAQMAAFDAEGKLTLVEQLQDAELGEPYPPRLVVIPGQTAFTVTLSGHLPDGLELDPESGILSGTPSAEGEFTFTVRAEDAEPDPVIKTYTIVVAAAGQELPPHAVVDTGAMPVGRGTTSGDGSYGIGEVAMLVAVPEPGYEFFGWTEKGKVISNLPSLSLPIDINHSVVASFIPSGGGGGGGGGGAGGGGNNVVGGSARSTHSPTAWDTYYDLANTYYGEYVAAGDINSAFAFYFYFYALAEYEVFTAQNAPGYALFQYFGNLGLYYYYISGGGSTGIFFYYYHYALAYYYYFASVGDYTNANLYFNYFLGAANGV